MTPASDAKPRGPIFVVGAMGSGTTVTRLILDAHPNIAIAQETGLARLLLANEWVPFWKFGGEWYGRLGMTAEDLNREQGQFYASLFQRFAEQQGAQRWGDKTPFHTWHMELLARVFPDSVFIGTVRHPGAVASSVHTRFKYTWGASFGHWRRSTTELAYRGAELGDRFALLRYEELVSDPEPVLRELFSWLGEPWDPRVLAFNEVHKERGTATKAEGGTRSDQPLDTRRIAKWQESMDNEGLTQLHNALPGLVQLFGYDRDDAFALAPLTTVPGSSLLLGSELAIRNKEFDRLIPWDERGRPTFENSHLTPAAMNDLKKRLAGSAASTSPARSKPAPDRGLGARARRLAHRLPPSVQARARRARAAVKGRSGSAT